MAKIKREYILATCFLSGVAAAISFVSLGTQEWVIANPKESLISGAAGDNVRIGLFYGLFNQYTGVESQFELTTVCAFDINVCALMCGANMVENLKKFYYNDGTIDQDACEAIVPERSYIHDPRYFIDRRVQTNTAEDRRYLNAGIWICTIIFLSLSGIIGLLAAILSIWNTVASPYQIYLSIFGLYIYNGVALLFVLLATGMYAGMYIKDIMHMVPFYNALKLDFVTDGEARLGYSFWINLISIVFYIASVALLYTRNYLISKEPSQKLEMEETESRDIFLY